MTFTDHIKSIALAEVGVREESTNRGKRVNEYKAATSLPPDQPWPWCAAFVCWVVSKAMREHMAATGKKLTFAAPRTAAAYGFDEWSLAQDDSTKTHRGHPGVAVGIFSLRSTSHCGIAISKPDSRGYFQSCEGNTNPGGSREGDGVYQRRRNVRDVRDFIEFKV
jgi:hypothetical protein